MRASAAILAAVLAATSLAADTIHLKNGRTIVADNIREKDGRVQYDIGDSTYAIPKSLVERIEIGGALPELAASASNADPAHAKKPEMAINLGASVTGADKLTAQIIHDGKVEVDALDTIEREGDKDKSAAAYFIAGRYEFDNGNREQGRSYLQHALSLEPDNPVLLTQYAAVLVQLSHLREGIENAERASQLAPDSADAWAVLGFAYFSADRSRDAIPAWQKSLDLRPDDGLRRYLARAQREVKAEADYSQTDTGQFTIRYEGSATSPALRQQIQDALDSDYNQLMSALGIVPRNPIPVILYTDQAFFDVTQAPSWTAALNDGKLRIPINGLAGITPELDKVLRHELTHSFINQAARGRCPQWLNEGFAMLMEGRSLGSHGARLASLFQMQKQISLNALEGSFMTFTGAEALLAYDESLAATQYLNDTYGMETLRRIVDGIGSGYSPEAALRNETHGGYAELERNIGTYLAQKYGN
ncbi:MAG TPA: peptidase MA family metallohydrolase [Terriglobales bacterium]|nr:peptidase MA family metallohydrolase [Terriglobales bacterium]